MTSTITLIGARGGHGTTTITAALAVSSAGYRPTTVVSADPACTAALLGVTPALDGEPTEITSTLRLDPSGPDPFPDNTPDGDPQRAVIIDAGRLPQPSWGPLTSPGGLRYAVLRGTCYVALASLMAAASFRFDGVIVVREPGRSLTDFDVTDVLGVPVVATVDASPNVARALHAGLLLSRLHRLPELRGLRALTAPPDHHPSAHQKPDTELLLSRGDRSRPHLGCRDRASRGHLWEPWTGSTATASTTGTTAEDLGPLLTVPEAGRGCWDLNGRVSGDHTRMLRKNLHGSVSIVADRRQAAIPEHARTMRSSANGCTPTVSPQIGRYRRLDGRGSGEDDERGTPVRSRPHRRSLTFGAAVRAQSGARRQ